MKAYVALHVRESPAGPAVVTPVPFPELAYQAASVAEAVEGVQPALKARVQSLEPVDRLPFASAPDATLLRVPLDVQVGGKGGETLAITLGVVVIRRVVRGAPVAVAYVPVMPNFEVLSAVGDLEDLTARVARQVAGRMRSWTASGVVNADEPDDSRLETLEIEVDAGGAAGDFHISNFLGVEARGSE